MMYCPYSSGSDKLTPFGVASLNNNNEVLVTINGEQHTLHFSDGIEAKKFVEDFYMSSLFYSMQ